MEIFKRTELILGTAALERLKNSSVAVFGLGGVGSYVVEALVRGGIGHIMICDNDTVDITNINRQIIATHSTVGRYKTDVMMERIHDINPDAEVTAVRKFADEENISEFSLNEYDYVVDAIDSMNSKLAIISTCSAANVPVISSMGTGNKLDPLQFEITDISKTSVCPVARAMRSRLRKAGINHLKVLYSRENPVRHPDFSDVKSIGSISFVPSAAGLMIAGEVIKDIIGQEK